MHLTVDLTAQTLSLWQDERLHARYGVSTGANGAGEIQGSGCTPRGWHKVRAKIGAALPAGTVLRGRRVAHDVPRFTPEAARAHPGRDWILSRILWLSGCEPGRNRLGCVDTFRRYIYIHGTPDDAPMGVPASHGCIRMRNADVIELFDRVPVGTDLYLHE
jgi:L,D-transpeptidase YbiS